MLLMGLAIVLIPFGKGALATIGMFPIIVFISMTLMTDGTVVGFNALFVAVSLRIITRAHPLHNYQVAALIGAAIVLGLLKYAYAPIIVLPLATRFGMHRRQKITYLAVSCAVIIGAAAWWQQRYAYTPNPDLYQRFKPQMFHKPVRTLLLLLINDIVTSFDAIKDDPCTVLSLMSLLFVMVCTLRIPHTLARTPFTRVYLTCGVIVVATLTLIYLSLFLTWNYHNAPMRTWNLMGVLPRYFYPLIPLILCAYLETTRIQSEQLHTVAD